MISRRGFFGRVVGALAAAVVAPRALFAREPLTTLGLNSGRTYSWKVTYVTASGETPLPLAPPFIMGPAIDRRIIYRPYGDGIYRRIGEVEGQSGVKFTDTQ